MLLISTGVQVVYNSGSKKISLSFYKNNYFKVKINYN